ncbi:MAG TPA: Asp-tRNA(Asn)/Glu-tRNA(Gln) amidotransferase subunit GatB [Burkholderiales bacterium]|nr:Asp-tRNA(Asn)/Glu-tRNA(Gln) amidotransferase subunit GatB [Burkholderiales bacterium]
MKWEVVIGLETHVQLNTRSKMFSGASTAFGAAPNAQACGVDIALPGVLPVANRAAVEKAVRFGLAVSGNSAQNINRRSIFARKNYFYPDLPKGYQISQYETPIVVGGAVTIFVGGREKTVRLTRAHLEEDAGKSLHEGLHDFSGIDLNRAGTPLLEIVSEPDMRSAEEAVAYARMLHSLVRWIDICDGNMQEGSFRCDANVSVRHEGADKLGTRREIKNLNSFRFLQQAIEYETRWQIDTLESGGRIEQATVLFDPATGETRAMRTKEDAHDYRYFPDPDLRPLQVSEQWIDQIRASMPELPAERRKRYEQRLSLTPYDASLLTSSREIADYYERSVSASDLKSFPGAPKQIANWTIGPLSSTVNAADLDFSEVKVSPESLARLSERVLDGTLSNKLAREVFDAMWAGEGGVDAIIEKRGLKQISDSGELEKICDQVIAGNAKQVEDYRAGKDRAFNSLVGQVMKATKGKANPQQVNDILKRKLSAT